MKDYAILHAELVDHLHERRLGWPLAIDMKLRVGHLAGDTSKRADSNVQSLVPVERAGIGKDKFIRSLLLCRLCLEDAEVGTISDDTTLGGT